MIHFFKSVYFNSRWNTNPVDSSNINLNWPGRPSGLKIIDELLEAFALHGSSSDATEKIRKRD